MYDAASLSDPHQSEAGHQRAKGALHVSFKRRDDATVLDNLRQDGCLKARFPRTERGAFACAVLLNSSGGVAAGDRLDVRIDAGEGCAATIATQAAERIYRALPGAGPAVIRNVVNVAPNACLEWLPQETILFDQAALDRTLDIHLAPDATFTGLETLIFGRTEMGEQVHTARITDRIRLHRGGRLMLHDAIRLHRDVEIQLNRRATSGGRPAVATLLHVGPDNVSRLEAMRRTLDGVDAGVSFWEGLLVVRIVANNMADARSAAVAALTLLRHGKPVPRVWMC